MADADADAAINEEILRIQEQHEQGLAAVPRNKVSTESFYTKTVTFADSPARTIH